MNRATQLRTNVLHAGEHRDPKSSPRLEHALARLPSLYGKAFRHYELYLGEVHGSDPSRPTLRERARTPERIRAATPHLERAIAEETSGLDTLEEALKLLE